MELEHEFLCPYCNAAISAFIDPSVESQTYIEDCEVCCNPFELSYMLENGEIVSFDVRSIEQ